jgi:outer membrane protein assembly factor BamE (lipoprotein component of BamABCDE complex)
VCRRLSRCAAKSDLAGKQCRCRLFLQIRRFTAQIIGHCLKAGRGHRRGAEEITAERRLQRRIALREAPLVSVDSAIGSLGHALDFASNAEVAGAHLTQRAIEIAEHRLEETLSQRSCLRLFALQAVQIEKRMDSNQLEAAIDRVGDSDIGKKTGLTCLLYNPAISELGGIPQEIASKQGHYRQHTCRPVDSTALSAKVKAKRWPEFSSVSTRTANRLDRKTSAQIAGLGHSCNRGNLPEPDKLAEIRPGSTTRDEVTKILGSPSSTGIFDSKNWYYISRKTKQVSFFDPDVLDQQVYIVAFDDKGVVKAVDHKDLKDGQDIEPAPGATPAPGRELTFVEQVLGNIGRFSKGSSSSGGGDSGGGSQGPKPYDPNH